MIEFIDTCKEAPYNVFKKKYDLAFSKNQKNIEAASIASFNNEKKEVDSRFVNIKFIDKDKFIFFSNYDSPKALAFKSHNQINALFFWGSINTQIRIRAKIKKTGKTFNSEYFKNRSIEKNALAICSNQSKKIDSYDSLLTNYKETLESNNLTKCPEYWGGFEFTPYFFEFWEGNDFRLNRRTVFEKINKTWNEFVIQP